MYLKYNNISLDADGSPIHPVLRLQNLSGRNHGILSNVKNLEFDINLAELSEISFSIPSLSICVTFAPKWVSCRQLIQSLFFKSSC